jgi:F420-dependent oxidoreductase-like protein
MKLGVMIEAQEGVGWEEWRNIVQWTEELGFESLWRSDHFFSLGGPKTRDALETFSCLLYTAQNSSRIRFGPLVLSMTFRHPAIVARMAAAVDQLSGGRLILGLGAGWNVAEHEAFGIPLPPPRPRIEALEDGVSVIKALFTQEPASYAGKHFQIKDAYLNPKPVQSPMPVLIGGSGEKRTLRVVARHADEWNAAPMPLERYREKVAALEAHCEREGRDPQTIARSLMCGYVTAQIEAEVDAKVKAVIERLPPQFRPPPSAPPRPMSMLTGTPAQLIEQIKMWEGEGVSRIMLQHREPPDRETLEFVAKEILPNV